MAGKRKVYIDVIVDDKGTTKRIAVDAKVLKDQLKGVSESAGGANKAQRGLAQTASSGSKNFANLASASGGLVQAYAVLAAQIFAVTAAFGFLREAANLSNLIAAQEQYGAVTGTSFRGISLALQDATEGQLKYKEAAQATAIASAAGLSASQITGLGTAAKNASLVLGRDLSDSFNRLVKGVTKAEPELLDELGIILRLKPATEQYAASIGKTADDLNAFERSQAVANFVLEEAESKFGTIAKTMDRDAFAVERFAKSFDDLINTIKKGIMPVIIPILNFLSENTYALAAAFAVVAVPITKAMLPAFDQMAERMQESADIAQQSALKSTAAFKDSTSALVNDLKTRQGAFDAADKAAKKGGVALGKPGTGKDTGMDFLSGASNSKKGAANANRILKNAEAQVNETGAKRTGILKKYNKQQLADLRASYELRAQAVKKFETRALFSFKTVSNGAKVAASSATLAWKKASLMMVRATNKMAKGMNTAMKGAGWLGMILLVYELGKAAYDAFFPMSKEAKKAQDEVENLNSKYSELNEHMSKIHDLNRNNPGLLTGTELLIQQGNAIEQANVFGVLQDIEKLDGLKGTEGFDELSASIKTTVDSLIVADPAFKALLDSEGKLTVASDKAKKAMLNRANAMIQTGAAAEQLAQSSKNVTNELNALFNSIPQAPLQSLQDALNKDYELKVQVAAGIPESQVIKDQMAALDADIKKYSTGTGSTTTTQQIPISNRNKNYRTVTTTTPLVTASDKEDLAAAQAARKALEGSQDRANKAVEDAGKLRAIVAVSVEKQLLIEDSILDNKEKIAKIDQVSQSFEAKKARLQASNLTAANAVSKALQKQVSATTAKELLDTQGVEKSSKQYKNAEKAVELAQQEVTIAEALEISQQAITTEKERQLDIQKRQIGEANAMLEMENRQAAAGRKRLALVQGVDGAGLSSADMGALKRAHEMESFDEQVRSKELEHTNALAALADLDATKDATKIQAANARIQALSNELAMLGVKKQLNLEMEGIALRTEEAELRSLQKKREELTINPVLAEFRRQMNEYEDKGASFSAAERESMYETIRAQEQVKIVTKGVAGVQNAFVDSLSAGIEGIITGTMTMKDAFKNMAMSVLGMIAKMITQMLVFRMLSGMMPGGAGAGAGAGGGGNVADLEIFKTSGSGLFPGSRHGGIMKGYATGGIARGRNAGYPAILHGTEAVVPLPSGGKIPVEMKNGGGGTNNVSINVNMSGDGSAEQSSNSDGQQGANIGKLLASVVQEELQKQKRPGGMLSPYGAA